MSEFSHLRNKLLAEQVEDQIYHYIRDTPQAAQVPTGEGKGYPGSTEAF